MESVLDISKKIKNIYGHTDYFSKYAPDILVSILIILFFLILIVYFFLKSSLGEVKEKLKKNRCDSRYIFFSGWVSKKKNQSSLEATMENMTICLNDLIYSVFLVFIEPLTNTIKNMFEKNVMQIKTTSLNVAQASSLNMLNVNLHVGMKLFRDHLTVLFIPIIKLNQIINDSLEKFILILHLIINSLEIYKLNIKHILISMYKALLKINIKLGNSAIDKISIGIRLIPLGIGLMAAGSFFPPLLLLGIVIFQLGFIIMFIGLLIYHIGFSSTKKKTESFYETIVELYPEVGLKKPKHDKMPKFKISRKKCLKTIKKIF